MRSFHCVLIVAAMIVGGADFSAVRAQQPDTARPPTAAFLGRIISNLDSTPVRSADIRLVFIDSVRQVRNRNGSDSLEVFADSNRARVTVTDSVGAFAVRRLAAGRYLFHIRRIGYEPAQGALVVDTGSISTTISLTVVSRVLAKVVVTETSVDRVKEKLDRNGFISRSHLGVAATFVQRSDILRAGRQTLGDLLAIYGIYDGAIMLDRMPFDVASVRDYPADLVIGMEIYRHSRPTEFNMTRRGANIMDPGGMANSMQPLVVIWTFIP
jgi:hypothetical protein